MSFSEKELRDTFTALRPPREFFKPNEIPAALKFGAIINDENGTLHYSDEFFERMGKKKLESLVHKLLGRRTLN